MEGERRECDNQFRDELINLSQLLRDKLKFYHRHVHVTVSTMSVFLALAGLLNHGIFEIRQGNTPTNGFFVEAISKADRFWIYGTEGAFTIVPNFLVTGIIVVAISLAIIVFAIKYLYVPNGARILLTLFVLLTLFGGGIGHLVVSLPACIYATQIHKPLGWFEKNIPKNIRKYLSNLWLFFLITTCFAWLVVMQLGIFGYVPGLNDPDTILSIVFVFLLATTVLLSFSILSAMAKDLQERH